MVIVLLVIIIIILVPSLIGIAAGATIGFMPIIIGGIVGGLVTFFLVKSFGISDDSILYEQAKQAIDDKYTAFYVLCADWKDGGLGLSPSFSVRQINVGGSYSSPDFMGLPHATFSYFPRNIEDVLNALKIPYNRTQTPEEERKLKGDLEKAYNRGKENYSNMKWYKGNIWNKFGNLMSDSSSVPNLHHLAHELEFMLNVKQ